MDDIIDLDVLLPKTVIIKFDGQEITIKQPSVEETIQFGYYVKELDKSESTGEGIEVAAANVRNHIWKLIPQLEGKAISIQQQRKLIDIIARMNLSEEELKNIENKITPKSDPKAIAD